MTSKPHSMSAAEALGRISELDFDAWHVLGAELHRLRSLEEQFELLVHFIRDEAKAGLPLPLPIRRIIAASSPAKERVPWGPDHPSYDEMGQ